MRDLGCVCVCVCVCEREREREREKESCPLVYLLPAIHRSSLLLVAASLLPLQYFSSFAEIIVSQLMLVGASQASITLVEILVCVCVCVHARVCVYVRACVCVCVWLAVAQQRACRGRSSSAQEV